ncbi:GGDEF domain-containing protein [Faecalibacillus intestinalis]
MQKELKKWFSIMFSTLIIVNLAEWGAASLDGVISMITLRIVLKFVEFIFTPFLAFVILMTTKKSKLQKLGMYVCIFNFILQVVSLFNGCVFSIDSQCIYHRNEFYVIYVLLFVTNTLLWLISCCKYIQKFQIKNTAMLAILFLIEIISFISQLVWSNLRLDWCFASIGALLYYIYLDMLMQQTDPLTQLLNRRIYEIHTRNLSAGATIIFLDVDSFKMVNDIYGHNVGDFCLSSIGNVIKKEFESLGYCYRYGGDEFCVILSKPCDNLKQHLTNIITTLASIRIRDNIDLPLVSYGYATLLNDESYEQALDRADKMMYQYKKLHRDA